MTAWQVNPCAISVIISIIITLIISISFFFLSESQEAPGSG